MGTVVKKAYDAIEQAVSAAIAATGASIPRLRRRSDSQYVDIRGDEINVPHEQFDRGDTERILEDAESIFDHIDQLIEL